MAQIAGNLQRIKNGQRRYAITPRIPAGFIQPDQLQKYIDVANKFGAVLKLTGRRRSVGNARHGAGVHGVQPRAQRQDLPWHNVL